MGTARKKNEKAVIPMLIEGMSQREVAQKTGLAQQTVSVISRRPEVRELVKEAQEKLINQSLNVAISNQSRKIELASIILSGKKKERDPNDTTNIGKPVHQIDTVSDKVILELAEKAEQGIMQSVGIAPSHTQSLVFTQIFNQTNQVLSPEVLELMNQAGKPAVDIDLEIPTLEACPDGENSGKGGGVA